MSESNSPPIAHFGILQSAFWRQNPRPIPPPLLSSEVHASVESKDPAYSRNDPTCPPSQDFQPNLSEITNSKQTRRQSSRPYACPEHGCSKSFLRKEHLNRHLTNHTGKRPFECSVCKRGFTRSDVLRRHMVQHSATLPLSRTAAACAHCHSRKLRCDSNTPCLTCSAAGMECVRSTLADTKDGGPGVLGNSPELGPDEPFMACPSLHPPGFNEPLAGPVG